MYAKWYISLLTEFTWEFFIKPLIHKEKNTQPSV